MHVADSPLIRLEHCSVSDGRQTFLSNLSWTMRRGEVWLIIGANGSGKSFFLEALAGRFCITADDTPHDSRACVTTSFGDSVEVVSLERAAQVIAEERLNDESEYTPGGIDIGRTGQLFIAEPLVGIVKNGALLPEAAQHIEAHPAVQVCGVAHILKRGLRYMSTGEIRRTLLARALVSGKKLLILSDPFTGLDADSRTVLLTFFNTMAQRQRTSPADEAVFPYIIISLERYVEVPDAITHVLEFTDGAISFCGERDRYEQLLRERESAHVAVHAGQKVVFTHGVAALAHERALMAGKSEYSAQGRPVDSEQHRTDTSAAETSAVLVEMNHVSVGWGDNRVLIDVSWSLRAHEHWLIRGPNGSGKTTFLELITGDNTQVFANDVRIFGQRRGSGESIWDIKKQLGIVSYRLHVEYRMVGSIALEDVIVSGFYDSIGLYISAADADRLAARSWLALGGFAGRESESFSALSYGEQRMILILRAVVKCPPLLILDEPCHGLDAHSRQRVLDLLETIAEIGSTTLLHVTHERDEVLACERHILELCPGQTPMYRIIEK
ncbi:MAG: ATP-binding cassette domain-containing protein [Treponema sp.]|nr:ATP-binding cassette domain-containing protein [Treponema sp.]